MERCYATIAQIGEEEIVLEIDDEDITRTFECGDQKRKTHLKRIPICSFKHQGFEINQGKVYIVEESFEEGWVKFIAISEKETEKRKKSLK